MEGKEKEVVIYNLKGYFKWVVTDNVILADQNYLEELFSYPLLA